MSGAFLYALMLGLVGGIASALLCSVGVTLLLICVAAALALLVLGTLIKNKYLFLIAILLAAVSLGVIRTDIFLAGQAAHNLAPYVGKNANVVGIIINDPERRATSLHVNVEVVQINGEPVQGTLLAILGRDEPVAYNDTVELLGEIQLPQSFETANGHIFDYPGYLQVQGVSALMQRGAVVNDMRAGFSIQGFLFNLKHMFEASVERVFPEPEGSLLEGILLGERRGISQQLTDAFVASGLVHVVVLSGHNITIVSEGVFRALSFLPRAGSYSVGASLMILFALMTGAGATTVRALVIALVALLARYMHRQALAMRSLAAAGAAMALWNPNELLHDPSFILSMLATFGLIALAPWIEQKISFVPKFKKFDMRSIAATTIAVEIFVTPMLLYLSGVLSFLSLPANIIALPVIPLAMLSGFIAGLLGLLHPVFGLVPALVCGALLKWLLLVVTTVQALPYSTATVQQFPAWLLIAVYIPLTAFALRMYNAAANK